MSDETESGAGERECDQQQRYGSCAACEPGITAVLLLHSFNRWTGMCRCGEGPLVTAEWVAHYKAQDEPTRTITDGGKDR